MLKSPKAGVEIETIAGNGARFKVGSRIKA